jgi:nucleoside-diphosphate-sugar epimerase
MTTTILVTGGAGYIGSHVCKALERDDLIPNRKGIPKRVEK